MMYLGRRKGSEYSGYFRKFLNHNADPLKRLKSLKNGLGKCIVWLCASVKVLLF